MEHVWQKIQNGMGTDCCLESNIKLVNMVGSENPVIVELGVFTGRSLSAFAIECFNKKKNFRIFGVDPFSSEWYASPHSWAAHDGDAVFNALKDNLVQFGLWEYVGTRIQILRETSVWASEHFGRDTIDLLYIDADHEYEAVRGDIESYIMKVRPGGIMAGHDFQYPPTHQAVVDYFGDKVKTLCKDVWYVNIEDE